MEEHFNESYIESNRYPKAIFKGQLLNFDVQNLDKKHILSGRLEMHGKSTSISVETHIIKEDNTMKFNGTFDVSADDFAIEIPKIVRNKVSDTVTISFDFLKARHQSGEFWVLRAQNFIDDLLIAHRNQCLTLIGQFITDQTSDPFKVGASFGVILAGKHGDLVE